MRKSFHQYYLTQLLEQRAFKSTYLAYPQGDMKLKVVVKIFDKECILPNQEYAKSLTETKAFLSLVHPHIVPVLNMGIEDRQPYIVTQYMPRGSLRQRLNVWSSTLADWTDAISIVMQIGQALIYAHERQIIHGNIKPDNIFFNVAGEALLTDFRAPHFIDISRLDYKTDLRTTSYMAPEQFIGKSTAYSDQYSLACVAYELIVGHGPFLGAQNFSSMWNKHATERPLPPTTLLPELPPGIEFAILKAMAKKPEERYTAMAVFMNALADEMPLSHSRKHTPIPEGQLDFPHSSSTSPYIYTLKMHTFSGSASLPVFTVEDNPVANEQTSLVLKQTTYPVKSITAPLAIDTPLRLSSSDRLLQVANPTQQSYNEQATVQAPPSLLKNQVSSRSKGFTTWGFALIIAVLFFIGSCILYVIIIGSHQAPLKYTTINSTAKITYTTSVTTKISITPSYSPTSIPTSTILPTQQNQQTEQSVNVGSISTSTNIQPIPKSTPLSNTTTPTPTPIGCVSGSFTVGVESSGSTTALVWFKTCAWTAGYVVLHYNVPSLVQQNVTMAYNGNTARWEFTIGKLGSGTSIAYSFDYQKAGIQYPSNEYIWTHP
jgi:serine/threonine protein kinase